MEINKYADQGMKSFVIIFVHTTKKVYITYGPRLPAVRAVVPNLKFSDINRTDFQEKKIMGIPWGNLHTFHYNGAR